MPSRIEEARTSIIGAARNVSGIYLSFLLVGIYVAIIVGSTTDEQLLIQRDLPLPLLSVALPISAFYLLVPLGFVLMHLYLLVHIYGLSLKLSDFQIALSDLPTPREKRDQKRLLPLFLISPIRIASD